MGVESLLTRGYVMNFEKINNLPAVREIGSQALHLILGDGQRKAATFEVSRVEGD